MGCTILRNEGGYPVDAERLEAAARAAFRVAGQDEGMTLTIVLTDDASARALNRRWRSVDRVTDVLSFAALPHGLAGEPRTAGDLVIAWPWVVRQAQRAGHALMDDLMLLVVHGTLHLLGHEHDSDRGHVAMWSAQAQALESLGIAPRLVAELAASGDMPPVSA